MAGLTQRSSAISACGTSVTSCSCCSSVGAYSKVSARTVKPASFSAAASSSPRWCIRAGLGVSPISSLTSRQAVCSGVSPGSGLPPGIMNPSLPCLRTVSTSPSRLRIATAHTLTTRCVLSMALCSVALRSAGSAAWAG
ncbi:Uncharacterised protein [Mycobacterium tuberculosis]|nr:Uncharacterised protein [Mycobacterium tuberculosis]